MATYMPSPGQFRGADADPEATLELFTDYLDKMEKVYRLSRGFNPVTGAKVDSTSDEKKDLLLVEGGDEIADLFKYVGKVLPEDTYAREGQGSPEEERKPNKCGVQALQHPPPGLPIL